MKLAIQLKDAGQDFEFYPTTNEIIRAVASDIKYRRGYRGQYRSILDVGAGNGKVLLALKEQADISELFAIEKSTILLNQLPPEVLVTGTDFEHQSLLSKQVDITFCNPPYSQFVAWAEKIIRESASALVYLVIPVRWQDSIEIADAVKFREAKASVIGSFDFLNAEDRQARAKAHLICVEMDRKCHSRSHRSGDEPDDAFERFFKAEFAGLVDRFEDKPEFGEGGEQAGEATAGGRRRPWSGLVVGPKYPEAMAGLYEREMANIRANYDKLSELDADLLREMDVSPDRIMRCLYARLKGLKNEYWSELFRNIGSIRERLASKPRQKMIETLQRHAGVDFNLSNIYAVLVWAIKNSNAYIDSQLIDVYETMVEKANVTLYKSNKRVWVDDRWRYNNDSSANSHYALDYRIVTHRHGGVDSGSYSFDRGLAESAALFIGDLLTIANNLGFHCENELPELSRAGKENWEPGKTMQFFDLDGALLMDVRGFKKGNLHLRFRKEFMLAMNVEYGRLKGWLKNPNQAVEETGEPDAAKFFNVNLQLLIGEPVHLLCA